MKRTGYRQTDKGQRGGSLLEFVVIAPFFFMMLVGIVAAGSLFFTHNALVDATRRGARYATMQAATNPAGSVWTTPSGCDTTSPSLTAIKNYAIYGNAAGTGPNVSGLQPSNICVEYSGFGVQTGTVTVSIQNYSYNFVIPGLSRVIAMPAYRTTVPGESAGASPAVCP
jgi:Flp pilus assembly protein TadG